MTKEEVEYRAKTIIGWREWCAMPDLNLAGVLAKVDTGAKTSSLHAFKIKQLKRDGEIWLSFTVHPLQRHRLPAIACQARLVDERTVTSSNGKSQVRPVVCTTLVLGLQTFEAELTLTNRDEMGFRMLLGRESLKKRFIVDPALSFALGACDESRLYEHP